MAVGQSESVFVCSLLRETNRLVSSSIGLLFLRTYTIVMTSSVTTYTRDQLLDLRSTSAIVAPLPRGVRKTLFSYGLWRPQRACAQHNKELRDRSARPVRSDRLPTFDDNDNKSKLIMNKNNFFIDIGCLNACTINGKSASLVNSMVESDLQIFAITETRHESSDDYNIKKNHARRFFMH